MIRQYDLLQGDNLRLGGNRDSRRRQELLVSLRGLKQQIEAFDTTIRSSSHRLATLKYPEPLGTTAAASALDPGTLMLSYSVGKDRTDLFLSTHDGPMEVKSLPIGEEEIRKAVTLLSSLGRKSESLSSEPRLSALHSVAGKLYNQLLGAAASNIERSDRLLIVPDGPLFVLPWGALIRSLPEAELGRNWQYLIEWKPIHTALSSTVYSEIKRLRAQVRNPANTIQLAAFGDPVYPTEFPDPGIQGFADAPLQALVKRGVVFERLPATRQEVEGIMSLYGHESRSYLGLEAVEYKVKTLPRSTRIVHFATHATLDERFPLNSAVVLSIPEKFEEGKDNGLLQAWEIFEQVRIDADLVVLSACESGLGKEMGGEGLIGLTRAFQYAGARSVMASLWKISDRTTAELMVRFYKHLKAGLPKDEALRAAQMELIHGPIQVKNEKGEVEEIDASAPYYWAAFQIYGDWQ